LIRMRRGSFVNAMDAKWSLKEYRAASVKSMTMSERLLARFSS
jgi:thiamine pyrophosphokinase